ncbi:MAG: hypothetical protein ACTHN2_16065 [Nitrobacter sp.]
MSDISQLLQDHEARISALEKRLEAAAGAPAQVAIPKKQSAKEFLLSKKISTETQKVVALAYFLEKQERLDSFNVPDLEAAFRAAREKLPKNMNDAVNKNVARGFLMEAEQKKDSKKSWQLTSTGERFVEQDMERAT